MSNFTAATMRRVKKGAALLDRVMPGWAKKIRPEKLDLHSCNQCVLGQLYRGRGQNGFDRGATKLGLMAGQESALGFDAQETRDSYFGNRGTDENDYDRLDRAWLFEIGRRVNGRVRGA